MHRVQITVSTLFLHNVEKCKIDMRLSEYILPSSRLELNVYAMQSLDNVILNTMRERYSSLAVYDQFSSSNLLKWLLLW